MIVYDIVNNMGYEPHRDLFHNSKYSRFNFLHQDSRGEAATNYSNLVPRVLSYPPYGARERETLENAGHVSPRIWEITNKRFGGGAGKFEICLYRA